MSAIVAKVQAPGSPVIPRLLNLRQAAEYVGVSYWTVRDWVLAGFVPTVELPALRAREGERQRTTLRRVLVDREDLDRFIESRKAPVMQSGASGANARNSAAVVPGPCPETKRARGQR